MPLHGITMTLGYLKLHFLDPTLGHPGLISGVCMFIKLLYKDIGHSILALYVLYTTTDTDTSICFLTLANEISSYLNFTYRSLWYITSYRWCIPVWNVHAFTILSFARQYWFPTLWIKTDIEVWLTNVVSFIVLFFNGNDICSALRNAWWGQDGRWRVLSIMGTDVVGMMPMLGCGSMATVRLALLAASQ